MSKLASLTRLMVALVQAALTDGTGRRRTGPTKGGAAVAVCRDLGNLFLQVHVIHMHMNNHAYHCWLFYCSLIVKKKVRCLITPKVLAGVALVATSASEMTMTRSC